MAIVPLSRETAPSSPDPAALTPRLIMYHKQSTSARTRFLAVAYGGVCAFDGLPESVELLAADTAVADKIAQHPGAVVGQAGRVLGLPPGALEADRGFRSQVMIDGRRVDIFLARLTAIDPPFEVAEANQGRFIDLTQARGLPPAELQLLRRVYQHVME